MLAGRLRHRIDLQRPTRTPTSDGYTETWAAYATRIPAEVLPSTPRMVERFVSATVQTPVTHLVTIRYRADVSVADRVVFGTRDLYIVGVQNINEQNIELVLACEERAV